MNNGEHQTSAKSKLPRGHVSKGHPHYMKSVTNYAKIKANRKYVLHIPGCGESLNAMLVPLAEAAHLHSGPDQALSGLLGRSPR